LAKAPVRLGSIEWADDDSLSITLDSTEGVTIDGAAQVHAVLLDDSDANPTTVAFGSVNFIAVDRGLLRSGCHGTRRSSSPPAR